MSAAACPSREKGAALIVGLILLTVLTVLAISTLRTATLNLTMSGNAQFRENAFQLAESGLQSTLRRIDAAALNLDSVPECPDGERPWSAAQLPWEDPVEVPEMRGRYQTRLCLEGATSDLPNTSIGEFVQLHYRIESRGRTDQRNAEALHTQGFFRMVEQ